jgi:phosphoribosylglycinamide formyltransferase 1
MFRIGVLASGKGSTFDNLAFHCSSKTDGMLYGCVEIVRLFTDRDCPALQIADQWGISTWTAKRKYFKSTEEWSNALFQEDLDLYVMAGFLSKVVVPENREGKILNIHPSLLPKYGGTGMYGIKVHEAVIANKEPITGCTVHVVDNEYDHGPVIDSVQVAVLATDTPATLQEAVQEMERRLYPRAILNYLKERRKYGK